VKTDAMLQHLLWLEWKPDVGFYVSIINSFSFYGLDNHGELCEAIEFK